MISTRSAQLDTDNAHCASLEPDGALMSGTIQFPSETRPTSSLATATSSPLAMVALLTLTGIYFIRPYEWVPGMIGFPLYQWVMIPSLLVFFGKWTKGLSFAALKEFPISACVVGLGAIVLASEVINNAAIDATWGFAKVFLFYLLLIGIVDSKTKLTIFLQGYAAVLCGLAGLIWANHYGLVHLEMGYSVDAAMAPVDNVRIEALGGANFDPNDTAVLMVSGILVAGHFATVARPLYLRPVWLAGAVAAARVLQLTDSRGGFLALLVGLAVYTVVRWGKKGIWLGAATVPLVAASMATERMTGIGSALREDTGQNRLQFWQSALVLFKQNPLLGSGPGGFMRHVGRAAHNTFLQAFAELGFVGGMLFLGAFVYAFLCMIRLAWTVARRRPYHDEDVEASDDESTPDGDESVLGGEQSPAVIPQAIPTAALVAALLAAYGMGILALNHLFGTETYLILGLATATAAVYHSSWRPLSSSLLVWGGAVSVAFIVASHVVARSMVRW